MYQELRRVRESKGITQEEISLKLGYKTKHAYSLKERGKRKFTLEEALQISSMLGKSIEDIFFDKKVDRTSTEKISIGA